MKVQTVKLSPARNSNNSSKRTSYLGAYYIPWGWDAISLRRIQRRPKKLKKSRNLRLNWMATAVAGIKNAHPLIACRYVNAIFLWDCSHLNLRKDNSTPAVTLGMPPTSPLTGAGNTLDTEDSSHNLPQIQQNALQTEQPLSPDFPFDFSKLPYDSSQSTQDQQILSYSSQIAIQPVANGSITDASENTMSSDNTTLCSLAFSLIMNNNRKGYDVAEIDLRLRAGYRYGSAPSDGCRVDNKILFSVLADIL